MCFIPGQTTTPPAKPKAWFCDPFIQVNSFNCTFLEVEVLQIWTLTWKGFLSGIEEIFVRENGTVPGFWKKNNQPESAMAMAHGVVLWWHTMIRHVQEGHQKATFCGMIGLAGVMVSNNSWCLGTVMDSFKAIYFFWGEWVGFHKCWDWERRGRHWLTDSSDALGNFYKTWKRRIQRSKHPQLRWASNRFANRISPQLSPIQWVLRSHWE